MRILLFDKPNCETEIEKITKHLNSSCEYLQFTRGDQFTLDDEVISCPGTYERLPNELTTRGCSRYRTAVYVTPTYGGVGGEEP